ncbi:MAG: hypothetical protein MZU84_05820 [Sphingobacterium sp.]|nr:hypothetical protein [Sphingobacterium sp.]
MRRYPRNPILTRADIPDIPPQLHGRHVGLQSRRGQDGQPHLPGPARPGPVARDLPAHGQERGRDPFHGAAGDRRARRHRQGPQEDLPHLRRPDHPARGRLLPHVRHGHGRRVPAGAGPDRELPGLSSSSASPGTRTSATASSSRRRSAASTSGSSGPTRPGSRAGRRRAARSGWPSSKDLVKWKPLRPGHERPLPLLGRVHRLRAAAGQDAAAAGSTSTTASRRTSGAPTSTRPGVVLLDLEDPTKVLGRSRCNILEPREPYELAGQVPNVVFPSGMVVEESDDEGFALPGSPVKVYYGAADTAVGLAVTTVGELLGGRLRSRRSRLTRLPVIC